MDWKYKHFHQERVYPAPRDVVFEAARAFMAESLRWQVANTQDGLMAQGYSFSHRPIANLRIQTAARVSPSECSGYRLQSRSSDRKSPTKVGTLNARLLVLSSDGLPACRHTVLRGEDGNRPLKCVRYSKLKHSVRRVK